MSLGLILTAAVLLCFLVAPYVLAKILIPNPNESVLWTLLIVVLQSLSICVLAVLCSRRAKPPATIGPFLVSSPRTLQDLCVSVISRTIGSRSELSHVGIPPGLANLFGNDADYCRITSTSTPLSPA